MSVKPVRAARFFCGRNRTLYDQEADYEAESHFNFTQCGIVRMPAGQRDG